MKEIDIVKEAEKVVRDFSDKIHRTHITFSKEFKKYTSVVYILDGNKNRIF